MINRKHNCISLLVFDCIYSFLQWVCIALFIRNLTGPSGSERNKNRFDTLCKHSSNAFLYPALVCVKLWFWEMWTKKEKKLYKSLCCGPLGWLISQVPHRGGGLHGNLSARGIIHFFCNLDHIHCQIAFEKESTRLLCNSVVFSLITLFPGQVCWRLTTNMA